MLRRRLLLLLVMLYAIKLLYDRFGDEAWTRTLAYFWQQRCMTYRLPAERLAYVAAPRGQELPSYLGDFSDATGSIWVGTIGAAPYPIELAELQRLTDPRKQIQWESLPAPVFLHGLVSSNRRRRMVTVYALANNPQAWWTLVASAREPVGLRREAKRTAIVSTASWPMPKLSDDTLVVFAGQPDPNDPSRFTVRVRLNGQEQIVTGVLKSDGTVEFTSSTGFSPWNTCRAGPLLLPQLAAPSLSEDCAGSILLPTD